jgi:hypothetical protein
MINDEKCDFFSISTTGQTAGPGPRQQPRHHIRSQLPGFTDVVVGDADLVPKMNIIGSTEGIRAAVSVRKQLRQLGELPEEWVNVVIRTVCAGTMKSYTENDLGHFALELAKKLEAEN